MTGSWRTRYAGYFILASDIAGLVARGIQEKGLPQDANTWILFMTFIGVGISSILSKDYNVSNAPKPAAATVVSAVNEATANPSAEKPELKS